MLRLVPSHTRLRRLRLHRAVLLAEEIRLCCCPGRVCGLSASWGADSAPNTTTADAAPNAKAADSTPNTKATTYAQTAHIAALSL